MMVYFFLGLLAFLSVGPNHPSITPNESDFKKEKPVIHSSPSEKKPKNKKKKRFSESELIYAHQDPRY
jgi:hypothetical protein